MIRDAALQRATDAGNTEKARLLRKANQQWDLAGLAREDDDHVSDVKHTEEALRLQQEALDL